MPRSHLVTLLLLASSALSQTPTPRAIPTIQTRTNLVVIDVVVTDRAGHNVRGLQQTEFALTEQGAPQQIRNFEEHTAPQQPALPPRPLDLPPGVFTNYSPAPTSGALNVLLLDTLNTPLLDQAFLRTQLLKYIRSAPAGNRIAIFGLATHLYLLQGFTSDPQLLLSAIDKKSIRPSQILDNPTSGLPAEQLSTNLANSGGDSHGSLSLTMANLQQFEAETQTFELQTRARHTLDGMNTLARYLASLPGRKNLIWFSGSFPLSVLPNGDLPDPFAAWADMSDEFRDTTNLLTRSRVSVYPVDARGLFNAPMYDVSQPSPRYADSSPAFGKDLQSFNQQLANEHATMLQMAEQTGGHAFINTNGLAKAVETAMDTGANFYTLTYTPKNDKYDGTFRKIGLHLQGRFAQAGLTLAYRRGYFAFDPNPPAPARRILAAGGNALPAGPAPMAMRSAMMRGAPEATQIIFKAQVLPALAASSPPEPAADPDTRISSDPRLAEGPWRRYAVDVATTPGQLLSTRAPDGTLSGVAELVVHCYNPEGALISAASRSVRLKLSPEDAQHSANTAVDLHQVISIPAKGEFFLRVGVHDLVRDHVGAIEVPVASIKNLRPAPSPPAPTAPATPTHP